MIAILLCLALPESLAAQTGRTSLVLHNGTGQARTVGVILAALDATGGVDDVSNSPVTADQLAAHGFCSERGVRGLSGPVRSALIHLPLASPVFPAHILG